MMTGYLPNAIELYGGIPERPSGGTFVGADSYLDDHDRLVVKLALKDDAGERRIRCHEGDTFEFAGATWKVAKIFGVYTGSGRPHIATISRVE